MSEKYKTMPEWADLFFDKLAQYGSQEAARRSCEQAGFKTKAPSTVSNWKKNSSEFRKRFDEAKIRHCEILEAELARRAIFGRDEPVVYRGQIQYQRNPATGVLLRDEEDRPIPVTIKKYSDDLLKLKLRAEMPDKYGGTEGIAIAALARAKDHEGDTVAPAKAELVDRLKRLREGKRAELKLIDGGQKQLVEPSK